MRWGDINLFVSKPHQSPGSPDTAASISPALKHKTKLKSDWVNKENKQTKKPTLK